jgi:hypothetical protein
MRMTNVSNDTSSATLVQFLRIYISNDGVFPSLQEELPRFCNQKESHHRSYGMLFIP